MKLYRWTWATLLPDRRGQRCHVLAWGRLNSCLLQFEDGAQFVTDRRGVRKA